MLLPEAEPALSLPLVVESALPLAAEFELWSPEVEAA